MLLEEINSRLRHHCLLIGLQVVFVLLALGDAARATEKDDAKLLAAENYDKLLGQFAIEHERKWYGWVKEEQKKLYSVFIEFNMTEKPSVIAVHDIPSDQFANANIERGYIVEFERACKARAKSTRHGAIARSPESLLGILPWSEATEFKHRGVVAVVKLKTKEKLEIVESNFELEKPTPAEFVCALNLDQGKLLPNDQRDLLEKFKKRFELVFPSAQNHYFLCLYAARSKSPISGGFDVKPIPTTLVEIAGVHQLWLQEVDLGEELKLNGIKRAFRCHVGIRGVKRFAKFTQKGMPLDIPANWTKWDNVDWSNWTARQSYISEWAFVESKNGNDWMLTDLGVRSTLQKKLTSSIFEPFSGIDVGFATKRLFAVDVSSPGNLIKCFCDDAEFANPSEFFVEGVASKTMLRELLKETKHEIVVIGDEVFVPAK